MVDRLTTCKLRRQLIHVKGDDSRLPSEALDQLIAKTGRGSGDEHQLALLSVTELPRRTRFAEQIPVIHGESVHELAEASPDAHVQTCLEHALGDVNAFVGIVFEEVGPKRSQDSLSHMGRCAGE